MTDRDTELDPFFDAARRSDPTPSDALMARVMADAAMTHAAAQPVIDHPKIPLWQRIMDVTGGWPALGGVMAAGLAGLWVGVAPPAGVEDWAAGVIGTTEGITFYEDLAVAGQEAFDG